MNHQNLSSSLFDEYTSILDRMKINAKLLGLMDVDGLYEEKSYIELVSELVELQEELREFENKYPQAAI